MGEQMVKVAVCGAHMSGLPLNWQLTESGGKLHSKTATSADYRLFLLDAFDPPRPGLLRFPVGGGQIELEVWELPVGNYGKFVAGIPSPLGIGTIELSNGSQVQGFLCESYATVQAKDITSFGGWRGYQRG
jgi:allophanate hydrolase